MELPATLYVSFGAVLAALIAGFFSFLNLVSSKENKVSEFRLSWINGLREEIASYTAALQEAARLEDSRLSLSDEPSDKSVEDRDIRWHEVSKDALRSVVNALTRIQLRLNPFHVRENPESYEAKLMACVLDGREKFNAGDYQAAYECSDAIRSAAAPLLKTTWDLVKNGESDYQRIRKYALRVIVIGFATLAIFVIILAALALVAHYAAKS